MQLQMPAEAVHVKAGRTPPERAALWQRIEPLNWVHRIDLGDGIVTPAKCDWQAQRKLITQAFDRTDFRGKKVLDIGCWDGQWSFEAERRGARAVYATDYVCQRHSTQDATFEVARAALGSKARYFPHISVFDVEQLGVSDFDVVIFCGVYYHLRDPLRALARLRRVMKDGAVLIVEGDAIYNRHDVSAQFFYRQWHNRDASNWWVPTIPCLRQWLESSFFDNVVEIRAETPEPAGMAAGAKRVLRRARPAPAAANRAHRDHGPSRPPRRPQLLLS